MPPSFVVDDDAGVVEADLCQFLALTVDADDAPLRFDEEEGQQEGATRHDPQPVRNIACLLVKVGLGIRQRLVNLKPGTQAPGLLAEALQRRLGALSLLPHP